MKIHFRTYKDYACLDTLMLQMYLKDNDGKAYIIKNIEFEEYKGQSVTPLNQNFYTQHHIEINEDELKRMSKELWSELDDETAYLKGNLKATQEHLQDMRKIAFMELNNNENTQIKANNEVI